MATQLAQYTAQAKSRGNKSFGIVSERMSARRVLQGRETGPEAGKWQSTTARRRGAAKLRLHSIPASGMATYCKKSGCTAKDTPRGRFGRRLVVGMADFCSRLLASAL